MGLCRWWQHVQPDGSLGEFSTGTPLSQSLKIRIRVQALEKLEVYQRSSE